MAKSSVPHGFTTTILVPAGNSDYVTIATIVQSELKPLGIKREHHTARPEHRQQRRAVAQVRHGPHALDDGHPRPGRAGDLRASTRTSGAKSFFTAYNNPTVVKDTHLAETTTDPAARQKLYNIVQAGAAKDAFMAFLYYSPYPTSTTTNVHGFFVTPLGNYHMEDVWLSK